MDVAQLPIQLCHHLFSLYPGGSQEQSVPFLGSSNGPWFGLILSEFPFRGSSATIYTSGLNGEQLNLLGDI